MLVFQTQKSSQIIWVCSELWGLFSVLFHGSKYLSSYLGLCRRFYYRRKRYCYHSKIQELSTPVFQDEGPGQVEIFSWLRDCTWSWRNICVSTQVCSWYNNRVWLTWCETNSGPYIIESETCISKRYATSRSRQILTTSRPPDLSYFHASRTKLHCSYPITIYA